jgi:hypothetical protein
LVSTSKPANSDVSAGNAGAALPMRTIDDDVFRPRKPENTRVAPFGKDASAFKVIVIVFDVRCAGVLCPIRAIENPATDNGAAPLNPLCISALGIAIPLDSMCILGEDCPKNGFSRQNMNITVAFAGRSEVKVNKSSPFTKYSAEWYRLDPVVGER